jgi:hypothetical protein
MKAAIALWAALLFGCEGGLRVINAGADTAKPANVRLLVSVEADKKPVMGLKPDSFAVYEDGVASTSADFTVASPDMTSMQYTALLLDWSGKLSDVEAQQMSEGADALVKKLKPKQKVAIYAFDGNADLHPVVPFTASDAQVTAGLDGLKTWKARDTTSNLNGAIVAGAKALRTEMGENLMHGGNLITVYRDADRASRATTKDIDDLFSQPDYSRIRRFAVSVGEPAKQARIGPAGSTETVAIEGPGVLPITLGKTGDTIASFGGSYYVVIVCSHARAGEHELKLEVTRKSVDDKGKESSQKGTLTHKFSADGFTAGCTPAIPSEVESLTIKPEPVPVKDEKKDKEKDKDKDEKKDDKKKDDKDVPKKEKDAPK